MSRRAYVASLLLAVMPSGLRAADSQTPAVPGAAFPSTVEVVNVDAVVLDERGDPVQGLTAADFTLKEDGQPQTITSFEAIAVTESAPTVSGGRQRVSTNATPTDPRERWIVVVFDDVNISQYATPRAHDAVIQFLTRGLQAGDQVMIAPTSGGAWWTGRLPQDLESLTAFVKRQQGALRPDTTPARIWDHEAYGIVTERDPQALARVARRYFETNLIPEAYPQDRDIAREVQVSPGLALIRAKAREVYSQSTARVRATLGSLERIADGLGALRGRKTLLLVSEGFIMDTSQREFRELVQAARRANAAIHYIDARSSEGMLGQAGMPGGGAEFSRDIEERDTTTALAFASQEAAGARSIALDTGGSIVAGTAALADGMAKIAREGRYFYLLGYSSTNAKRDGKFRKIELTVARPKLEVRARRGYYAPRDGEQRPLAKGELDPLVRAGLDAPFGQSGLPLRLTSYVFGAQAEGKAQAALVAAADLAPLRLKARDGKYQAKLHAYVVIHGRDNNLADRQETLLELALPEDVYRSVLRSGVPIRREFTLPPGHYQARLLVREETSGLVGSVRHEFEVPQKGALRASTPILTDQFQAVPGGAPRPVPVAHREFRAGAPLACAFEVYGAAPDAAAGGLRVSVSYKLRRADGTEVSSSPARRVEGRSLLALSQVITLDLPRDAVGAHELLVSVRDEAGGRTLELAEPFTVVRQ